jgi:hypothetical protein
MTAGSAPYSAELAARRTAAAAVLADYDEWLSGARISFHGVIDWRMAAERLAVELRSLLDATCTDTSAPSGPTGE